MRPAISPAPIVTGRRPTTAVAGPAAPATPVARPPGADTGAAADIAAAIAAADSCASARASSCVAASAAAVSGAGLNFALARLPADCAEVGRSGTCSASSGHGGRTPAAPPPEPRALCTNELLSSAIVCGRFTSCPRPPSPGPPLPVQYSMWCGPECGLPWYKC